MPKFGIRYGNVQKTKDQLYYSSILFNIQHQYYLKKCLSLLIHFGNHFKKVNNRFFAF